MKLIIKHAFIWLTIGFFPLTAGGQMLNDVPEDFELESTRYQKELSLPGESRRDSLPWYHPRHLKLQYAGSIGFFSVGAGTRIGGSYEPSLYYGLLANGFGGSSVTVHTISLKNSFYLTETPWFNHFYPKAGLSLNWGHTNNTFRTLPPHYPNRYYFQNRLHVAPFWGGEWRMGMTTRYFKDAGLYFEFSALDAYLLEAVRTKYVRMRDIWSLGVGITFYLH